MITVKIPATSANVGAGFDSLGLAVTLYNQIHLELAEKTEIISLDHVEIPCDETNLVYTTMCSLFELCGQKIDRKSTRLNSSHSRASRMPSSA